MVGIVLEQHPDRTRLFMQWKEMEWPVLVDALNIFEFKVVPVGILIDESGIVRAVSPRKADFEKFMTADPRPAQPPIAAAVSAADAMIFTGERKPRDHAIAAYEKSLRENPDDGSTLFRLGVAHRMRYDSPDGTPDDFARAIDYWQRSLDVDPNQYIRRRRIQQYGPRLDKPYPFYDWVTEARAAITNRGETPHSLTVEPGGAEIAHPAREFSSAADSAPPAQDAVITRDNAHIAIETIQVATTQGRGRRVVRVHVLLEPNAKAHSHWNNEAEPLTIRLTSPEGWALDTRHLTVTNAPAATSTEVRTIEFEVDLPAGATGSLTGYALYNVCEGANGTCLYRRQDFTVTITAP